MAKEIVLPGEFLDERRGRKVGRGTYFEGDKVFAKVLGIPRTDEDEISVIPLSGVYLPVIGDRVVAVVTEVQVSGSSLMRVLLIGKLLFLKKIYQSNANSTICFSLGT